MSYIKNYYITEDDTRDVAILYRRESGMKCLLKIDREIKRVKTYLKQRRSKANELF